MDKNTPHQHTSVSLPQPVLSNTPQQNVGVEVPQQPVSNQQLAPISVIQDSNNIEPEWVTRVDSLVRQGVNDPRLLSREFEKLKSQYIAGRYGKETKQQPDRKG